MNARALMLIAVMTLFAGPTMTGPASAGEGKIGIKTVDDPNAGTGPGQGTAFGAINAWGVLAGVYIGSNGTTHAVVSKPPYGSGTFTTVALPSNVGVSLVAGINLEGVVTGSYVDGSLVNHGFVSKPPYNNHTFQTIDVPGAGIGAPCLVGNQGTQPANINDAGTIAGAYTDSSCVYHAFVIKPPYTAGDITTFDATGACSGTGCSETGTAMSTFDALNVFGVIGGYYTDASGTEHGYLTAPPYTQPTRTIDVPSATFTTTVGVNLWGAIAGFYGDTSGLVHGFVSYPPFTRFTTFDGPGNPPETGPQSINAGGAAVGYYVDASFVAHGFLRAVNGTITPFDAPGACSADVCYGTLALANNDAGEITGEYFDATGVVHGFVGEPKD
jgi:hypothetical protein